MSTSRIKAAASTPRRPSLASSASSGVVASEISPTAGLTRRLTTTTKKEPPRVRKSSIVADAQYTAVTEASSPATPASPASPTSPTAQSGLAGAGPPTPRLVKPATPPALALSAVSTPATPASPSQQSVSTAVTDDNLATARLVTVDVDEKRISPTPSTPVQPPTPLLSKRLETPTLASPPSRSGSRISRASTPPPVKVVATTIGGSTAAEPVDEEVPTTTFAVMRSAVSAVCEIVQGYVFWSFVVYFFQQQGAMFSLYPSQVVFVCLMFILLVCPPILNVIPVVRSFMSRFQALFSLPAIAALMLFVYSDLYVRVIFNAAAMGAFVWQMGLTNDLPLYQFERFWIGRITGVFVLVAARLGTFSINPIQYTLVWNIVLVAVCASAVCALVVLNWMEYNELKAVAPMDFDVESGAAVAPKDSATELRPMAWGDEEEIKTQHENEEKLTKCFKISDYFITGSDGLALGCLMFLTMFYISTPAAINRLFPSSMTGYGVELGTVLAYLLGLLLSLWVSYTVFWILPLIAGTVLVVHYPAMTYGGYAGGWLINISLPMAWVAFMYELRSMKGKITGVLIIGMLTFLWWVFAEHATTVGGVVPGFGQLFVRNLGYYVLWPSVCGLILLPLVAALRRGLPYKSIWLAIADYRAAAAEIFIAMLVITLGVVIASIVYRTVDYVNPTIAATPTSQLRVVSWNINQGVAADGKHALDLALAGLSALSPGIVALQQADGTHITTGGVDPSQYLSNRLGLYEQYGPCSYYRTLGAASLSNLPQTSTVDILPLASSSSFSRPIISTVYTFNGTSIRFINVEVEYTPTEGLLQAQTIAAAVSAATESAVVVAGTIPYSSSHAVMTTLLATGLQSAYSGSTATFLDGTIVDYVLYKGLMLQSASVSTLNAGYPHSAVIATFSTP